MTRTVAVVQARMASTRLPGKVMKVLGNKRAIAWAVNAAMRAPGVDMVVVATSENEENDVLEGWCHKNGVRCFRGAEDDVLHRYGGLIRSFFSGDDGNIVRLTADCPLLDSHVIGETIALHHSTGASYTTNQWPPNWPDGLDVEVVSTNAILVAEGEATSPIDRETVTQFIWRNQSRWPSSTLPCPLPGLHKERWVLDSPEDYELMKLIFKSFPDDWEPNYLDIWHLLNAHPDWRKINTQWTRNQRFFESLAKEAEKTIDTKRNVSHLKRALKVIPNASQTFSKSCIALPSGAPLFASHGSGAYIFDIDGNRYVDLIGSLLPNILGYNDPDVDFAIRSQLDRGINLSLATELETELAETLVSLIPCAEMVRFGKNGSDATSAAIRLARFHTERDFIGIIAGEGYHGWHDWAVANTSRDGGVPSITKYLSHRMRPIFEEIKEKLCRHRYAAVIIDPENHSKSFLYLLAQTCTDVGTLLIFDEIRTGFRYALGGYQEWCVVIPDLACFGKSMANGMPISALVGPKSVMDVLNNKDGPFWSGTFFGETLSLAAAIATIKKIKKEGVIEYLWNLGATIKEFTNDIPGYNGVCLGGSNFRPLVISDDEECRIKFVNSMVSSGVLLINSNNLCFSIGPNELEIIKNAYRKALQ